MLLCWWQDDTSEEQKRYRKGVHQPLNKHRAARQETNNGTTQAKTGTPSLQHCHPLTSPTRGLLRGPRGNRTTEVAALDCDKSRQGYQEKVVRLAALSVCSPRDSRGVLMLMLLGER